MCIRDRFTPGPSADTHPSHRISSRGSINNSVRILSASHHGEIPVNMHSLQLSGVTKPVLTKVRRSFSVELVRNIAQRLFPLTDTLRFQLRSRGTSIRSAQAHPRSVRCTYSSLSAEIFFLTLRLVLSYILALSQPIRPR